MKRAYVVAALLACLVSPWTYSETLGQSVSVHIELDHATFIPGEPVSFHLQLDNRADRNISAALVVKPVFHRYATILVRPASAPTFTSVAYPKEWLEGVVAAEEPELFHFSPKGVQKVHISIAVDPVRRTFLFPSPGLYEMKMVLYRRWVTPIDVLETPAVTVTIVDATPADEMAMNDGWDIELASMAQFDGASGGPWFSKNLARAISFVDTHPNSRLSSHLQRSIMSMLKDYKSSGLLRPEHRELYDRWALTSRDR